MNAMKLGAIVMAVALGVWCLSRWVVPSDVDPGEPAASREAGAPVEPSPGDLAAPESGPIVEGARRALEEGAPAETAPVAISIRGRVVDSAGTGVAGARVLAANRRGVFPVALDADRLLPREGEAPRFETRSDEEGRFALGGPAPGPLRMAVRAGGFAPFDDDERYLPEGEVLDVGNLVLTPGVVLSGRVIDPDGDGVAGASISRDAEVPGGFFPIAARAPLVETGDDGEFRLTLAPGPWKLVVEAEGYPIRVEEGLELDPVVKDGLVIRLDPQWTIAGRVVPAVAQDGADLSAIHVRLVFDRDQPEPPDMLNEHRRQDVPCAADGTFRFTNIRSVESDEPSRYRIHAYRVYGNMGRRMCDEVVVGAGDQDVTLSLLPTAGIGFQLVDSSTGAAISDPRISLGPGSMNHIVVSGTDSLRAEADGRFRIVDVPPLADRTETWLWIAKDGYFDRVVPGVAFAPGALTDIGRIELSPVPTVRVSVVDARTNLPVADAEVTADCPSIPRFGQRFQDTTPPTDFLPRQDKATTDEEGVARVRVPLEETAMIRVAHADFAIHPDVPVLATEVGETSLTVALGQGGTVEVVVRDGLAAPAVGVDVLGDVVGDGARLIEPRVTTDASGIARYEHLTATRHQFRLADPPRSVGDSVQEVEVAAGETRVLHLTAPVKAWLEGRITEAGVALAGAKLHAVPGAPDDPESMIPWNEPTGQLTDTEGRFRIGPFEVGEWTLIVGHGSRALRDHVQVTVARDAPPVVIDLHVSEVAGTVAAPSGTPFAGEAVYAFRAMSETQAMNALLSGNSVDEERLKRSRVGLAWTDASGRYRLRGVPADAPIRVAAIPDTCQPALSPPFIVARGAVREGVDLAPLPGGRLEVRLTAPEEKRQMLRFHRVSAVLAGAESDDTAKRRVSTDSGGGALLRNLAPGVWTVEVTESFGDGVVAGPKPVTVKAGETATLAFEVP